MPAPTSRETIVIPTAASPSCTIAIIISPRSAKRTMLRAISEVAVATTVASVGPNPASRASSLACCRAATTSASTRTGTRTSSPPPRCGGRATIRSRRHRTHIRASGTPRPTPPAGADRRPTARAGPGDTVTTVAHLRARGGTQRAASPRDRLSRFATAPGVDPIDSAERRRASPVDLVGHEDVPFARLQSAESSPNGRRLLVLDERSVGRRRLTGIEQPVFVTPTRVGAAPERGHEVPCNDNGIRPDRPIIQPAARPEHPNQRLLDQIINGIAVRHSRGDDPTNHSRNPVHVGRQHVVPGVVDRPQHPLGRYPWAQDFIPRLRHSSQAMRPAEISIRRVMNTVEGVSTERGGPGRRTTTESIGCSTWSAPRGGAFHRQAGYSLNSREI